MISEAVRERTLLDESRLVRLLEMSSEIHSSEIPGCIIEVGVYRGGSALLLAQANPDREILLFDTFEGIPHEPWDLDAHKKGDFPASFAEVSELFSGFPNVRIHAGVFPLTCPKGMGPVALAHIDVDMERSVWDSIIFLWPLVTPGGFMVFDDYAAEGCRGVRRAVDEMFGDQVVMSAPPQAWVQRPRRY
jgi:O-methyltransferase